MPEIAERDNIGDDIRSAMAAQIEAPEPEQIEDVATDVRQAATETETAAEARARDERGRFAAKEQAPEAPVQTKAATPDSPASETILPPRSWTPQAKADFTTLPKHIQAEVLKREGDIEKGQTEWQSRGEKLKAFEQVIAPHAQRWSLNGTSETAGIQRLLNAEMGLLNDPVNTIGELMRQTGVTPQHIAQLFGMQGQPQAPQGMPQNDAALQRIQTLERYLAQQQQSQEQQAQSAIASQIQEFSGDPKNLYFENVKEDMAILLRSERAKDLASAYEMACWQRPDIRPLMLADQAKAEAAKAKSDAAARVAAARQAGGSVTGSPGPGAAVRASNPRNSVKDDILEAMNEHLSHA